MKIKILLRLGVFYLLLLFVGLPKAIAQVDLPSASIEIKGKEINKVPQEVQVAPFDYKKQDTRIKSGTLFFDSKMKLSDPFTAKEKRTIRFVEGNDFAKKDYTALEKKMNKDAVTQRKDVELSPEFYKDQNLGEFRSGSKFVNFVYRDHQYVDGDRVSVTINDTIINPNVWLSGEFRGFYIDLKKGFNKIDITALNQGSSGPNTAQFIMYDDKRNVISSNIWNLATGVTASVIIIKD
ncbi:hypothetical protein [Dokdonia sp. Hel_I_53]|uniref:hypothetical protein n=1 Tax=Dokdonia sp. Hel_I_53 TaxID=1566287 RepID=UPI00119C3A84|nr:hypothetical protein [Dokdonia sp. Hel_I_53]TVZ51607.1 hypothetical protein OD90_0755 [Dokdonia sp. Hel_I_53]